MKNEKKANEMKIDLVQLEEERILVYSLENIRGGTYCGLTCRDVDENAKYYSTEI